MTNPEDQFEDLKTLLTCKRYEQPPPGYFATFSDRVVAQLEAEELQTTSWWSWLLARFDAKPVLVCAYGLAVSSLLMVGFKLSQVFDTDLNAAAIVGGGQWFVSGPTSPLLPGHEWTQPAALSSAEPLEFSRRSMYPIFSAARVAFSEEPSHWLTPINGLRYQTAGFAFQGQ